MAKLYPPYLEGTLPAFCLDVETGDGVLTIPFAHNKAVDARNDAVGIAIKVKTVQNDVLITSFITGEETNGVYIDNEDGSGLVQFQINNFHVQGLEGWTITIGQYYKIQLAYLYRGTKEIGYYSTVGVIKCTSKPDVIIIGFDPYKVNNNRVEFVGQFKQEVGGDITEKVYSSKFVITDLAGNVVVTSGDVLHNVENNPNSYSSQDTMSFNRDLNFGEIYKIVYSVVTTNGLVISSPEYLITQQRSLSTELKGKLIASLNYDEGFIDLSLQGYVDEEGVEEIGNGSFLLSREDSVNPGEWEELCRFALKYESPTKTIFRDFTIEQGKTYTYCIQQYNAEKIYSDRKKSNKIYADFEDSFIYDGEQQLKLRFNPQVSSFKTQLSEARSETIGSKYPFFFRNARIGYKTFPVSGLISMESDENQFFTSFKSILKEDFSADRHAINRKLVPDAYSHLDLRSENFVSERLFKLKVLDWINNGKVKLFKSPSEGNYLVRFMDTSMSPERALGRMLHNLNTTAYESAECTYKNMVKYGIVEDTSTNETTTAAYVTQWGEKNIGGQELVNSTSNKDMYYSDNLLVADIDQPYTTILRFMDLIPGTMIRLVFDISGEYNALNHEDITIGATGNYLADDIEKVYGIYIEQSADLGKYFVSGTGTLIYEYAVPARNMFDLITNIQTDIGCYGQIVGKCDNVTEHFNNIREQVTQITMSNYHKRPVEYLFFDADEIDKIQAGSWWSGRDENGYRKMYSELPKFYWDIGFDENEIFDDKESLEYSPFSLYVLRDSIINGQDVKNHVYRTYAAEHTDEEKAEITHQVDHMFERYYIDRYIASQTAEDNLTYYTLFYKEYLALEQEYEEKKAAEEDCSELEELLELIRTTIKELPLYVLDAWNGQIYQVGVGDWFYEPIIIHNDEEIDLREIQNYSLDNLEIDSSIVKTRNGVYCEVYYQNAVKTFQLEKEKLNLQVTGAKNAWLSALETLEGYVVNPEIGNAQIVSQQEEVTRLYNIYLALLKNAVDNWTTRLE